MSDPQDPILILLNRLSESQVEQGRKFDGTITEIHETRRTLDVLAARLEPLVGLPGRLASAETSIARHSDKITGNVAKIDSLDSRVCQLESRDNRRSGWEMPAGKVGLAVLTFIFGGIGTMILMLVRQ